MSRLSHPHPFLILAAALWLSFGCAAKPKLGYAPEEISPASVDSLFARLELQFNGGDYDGAERVGRQIIYNYPRYSRIDEVHLIAAKASFAADRFGQAIKYASMVTERFPTSRYVEEALSIEASCYASVGKYYESADAMLKLVSSVSDPELKVRYISSIRDIAQNKIGAGDLERLIRNHPSSFLAGEISLTLAKKEFARGNYDHAYGLLADLLYQFPEDPHAMEIRQLLQLAASRRSQPDKQVTYVDPFKIGVLLPYTGNYSRYGRYFEQGVNLALDEHAASGGAPVTVAKADSKANPVDAVKAVRRLAVEEGVIAILGSVFTMPTVAAAIEANAWRVPMLSPVVSERLTEVGPWVFQTKVPDEVEITAMARLALEGLSLRRFAVLAPATGAKRRLAGFFIKEIGHRGGQVVAEQYYDEGATDFKRQLEIIRESAPEALFIPGSPDELILILPQVSFYDMQIQLLGLSDWNSDKLLRISKRDLEGALFPFEGYLGKEPRAYQSFLAMYRGKFGGEPNSITVAGYFGMKTLLGAVKGGAVDREQLREILFNEVGAGAGNRMKEANTLSILKVSSGKPREFTAFAPRN